MGGDVGRVVGEGEGTGVEVATAVPVGTGNAVAVLLGATVPAAGVMDG
jgi:hypothetical protein